MINGEDMRIAHHEAGHVVAGLHFGRRVDLVGRSRGHGLTRCDPVLVNSEITRRAVESGVITLAPFFEHPVSCAYDLAAMDGMLAAGFPVSKVWGETATLVSDPEYRRTVRVVESALWGHPYLTGHEVVLLIAAS